MTILAHLTAADINSAIDILGPNHPVTDALFAIVNDTDAIVLKDAEFNEHILHAQENYDALRFLAKAIERIK